MAGATCPGCLAGRVGKVAGVDSQGVARRVWIRPPSWFLSAASGAAMPLDSCHSLILPPVYAV
jgi:hypothetical protein